MIPGHHDDTDAGGVCGGHRVWHLGAWRVPHRDEPEPCQACFVGVGAHRQRQHPQTLLRFVVGEVCPVAAVLLVERRPGQQHLGGALQIAASTVHGLHAGACELPETVEGTGIDDRGGGADGCHVGALRDEIAKQAEIQRIAGAGVQVAVVDEGHRPVRLGRGHRMQSAHIHAVVRQGAGLVGADHRHRAQGLDGREPPHHSASSGHAFDAEGQGDRQYGGQALRHGGHREGDGKDHHVRGPVPAFGSNAGNTQRDGQHQDRTGHLVSEAVDSAFQRSRGGGDAAEQRRHLSHAAGRTRAGHFKPGGAAHQQGAAHRGVAGGAIDGDGLAGQHRFVEHHALGVSQCAVGRNPVTRIQSDPVAGHQCGGGHPGQLAIATDPGRGCGQGVEVIERPLGPPFLRESQPGVQHEDGGNRKRFDWPAAMVLRQPDAGVKQHRADQQQDQGTAELPQQSPPPRDGRWCR